MLKQFILRCHKKARPLLIAVMCIYGVAAMADDMVLQVWLADGQIVSINLNEEPRTTYNEGKLVITTTKTTITYPLENVKRYTYVSSANSINTPNTTGTTFSADGETLTFTGLKTDTSIMLYNVAGRLLHSITPDSAGHAVVSVSRLPKGVYIVKMNDATYKITKR